MPNTDPVGPPGLPTGRTELLTDERGRRVGNCAAGTHAPPGGDPCGNVGLVLLFNTPGTIRSITSIALSAADTPPFGSKAGMSLFLVFLLSVQVVLTQVVTGRRNVLSAAFTF